MEILDSNYFYVRKCYTYIRESAFSGWKNIKLKIKETRILKIQSVEILDTTNIDPGIRAIYSQQLRPQWSC